MSNFTKFIYESIETLKEVKVPTYEEVFNMTVAVIVIVILLWIYLWIWDWVFFNLYEIFHNLMK